MGAEAQTLAFTLTISDTSLRLSPGLRQKEGKLEDFGVMSYGEVWPFSQPARGRSNLTSGRRWSLFFSFLEILKI